MALLYPEEIRRGKLDKSAADWMEGRVGRRLPAAFSLPLMRVEAWDMADLVFSRIISDPGIRLAGVAIVPPTGHKHIELFDY